jgi:hypothetical protein
LNRFHAKASGSQPLQGLMFGDRIVEPIETLISPEHYQPPVMIGRDVFIRLDR